MYSHCKSYIKVYQRFTERCRTLLFKNVSPIAITIIPTISQYHYKSPKPILNTSEPNINLTLLMSNNPLILRNPGNSLPWSVTAVPRLCYWKGILKRTLWNWNIFIYRFYKYPTCRVCCGLKIYFYCCNVCLSTRTYWFFNDY